MKKYWTLWPAVAIWTAFCVDSVAAQDYSQLPAVNVGTYQQGGSPQFPINGQQLERIQPAAHFMQPEIPAAGGPFVGPTPVESLIQYAMANNPEIQALRFKAAALGAQVPQVKSLPDPLLLTTVFLEEIQTAAGPQEVAMTLAQQFPWFGKLALRSQVAYQNSMAAYARVTVTELEVVEQVKKAYFDVYFVQNAIIETEKLERPLVDVMEIARAKYESNIPNAGLETLLQAQVELAILDTTLIGFEESLIDAQATLAGVLHLSPHTRIEAKPAVARSNLAHTAENLVGMIERCQPELEAWRQEIGRDRSSIDLAKRDYWPDVTLGLSWYEMGNRGLSPISDGRDAYSLGVGVNLPIYRKRLDAAVREARYKTSSSTRRYQAAQDRFQAEVDGLYARFREQDRVLRILEEKIIPPAEQVLELSTEAYRAGTFEFQQLIDAYRTLLSARIDYHKRIANREQVIASLERAVGCSITSGGLQVADNSSTPTAPLPPLMR